MTSPGHWWVQWPALGWASPGCSACCGSLRAVVLAGGLAALAARPADAPLSRLGDGDYGTDDRQRRAVEHRAVVVARRPRQQRADVLASPAPSWARRAVHRHDDRLREVDDVGRQQQREARDAARARLEAVAARTTSTRPDGRPRAKQPPRRAAPAPRAETARAASDARRPGRPRCAIRRAGVAIERRHESPAMSATGAAVDLEHAGRRTRRPICSASLPGTHLHDARAAFLARVAAQPKSGSQRSATVLVSASGDVARPRAEFVDRPATGCGCSDPCARSPTTAAAGAAGAGWSCTNAS